jgi:hypothetical protein
MIFGCCHLRHYAIAASFHFRFAATDFAAPASPLPLLITLIISP